MIPDRSVELQLQALVIMNRKHSLCTLNLSPGFFVAPLQVSSPSASTKKRLAEACAWLEGLQLQNLQGQAPPFAKLVEQRIIWRELLDLELQEVDEQIKRVSAAARTELE